MGSSAGDAKDYRINIKVRNARLLRAIEGAGYRPGAKFAEAAGIPYVKLLAFLNLELSPYHDETGLLESAAQLCIFLKASPDDLWSESQLLPRAVNEAEFDLSLNDVSHLLTDSGNSEEAANPLAMLEQKDINAAIDNAMETGLNRREALILRMRYGVGTNEAHSLYSVACRLDLPLERIRQIENKALAKLRNPKHERLREAIDYETWREDNRKYLKDEN